MAGFEKTAKTPRAGRFPPPRRGPRRHSRLGLLTALDARRLRQSRDRRPCLHDLASSTAVSFLGFVAQTKKPPSVAACALDPGVDATAAARYELHRSQHLHGSSPPTLDARVPAIQRPSTRSHRTVDNSLITGRVEYSHSSRGKITLLIVVTNGIPVITPSN